MTLFLTPNGERTSLALKQVAILRPVGIESRKQAKTLKNSWNSKKSIAVVWIRNLELGIQKSGWRTCKKRITWILLYLWNRDGSPLLIHQPDRFSTDLAGGGTGCDKRTTVPICLQIYNIFFIMQPSRQKPFQQVINNPCWKLLLLYNMFVRDKTVPLTL